MSVTATATATPTAAPLVTAPGSGRLIRSLHTVRVLVETAELSVLDVLVRREEGPPMHIHDREDETFIVREGHVTFYVGDQQIDAPAGTVAMLPRGVPHTFALHGETARLTVICTPGGFEGMFDAIPLPVDMAVAEAAFARFGIRAVGPNPALA